MSMNSLANLAVTRRTDFAPVGCPRNLREIAAAAATLPAPLPAPAPAAPPAPPAADEINTALHVISGYIPTEVLTLYVAVLAALHKPNQISRAEWSTLWIFLIATPIVVWLVYAAKIKAAQKPLPLAPSQWPVWEMFSATIAYCAWAFALPGTPFTEYSWYSSALAGIIVLVASTFLGLLAPFFLRPIKV